LVIQAIAPVDIRFGWKRIQSLGQRLLPSTLTAGSSRPSAAADDRQLPDQLKIFGLNRYPPQD
jgi:hypothetical protein